jgi:hypothetical protein
MVACGTSGLFGGRRVVLPFADNSLIPAFFARGFLVVAFVVFFAVDFGLAIFLFSLKCFLLTSYIALFVIGRQAFGAVFTNLGRKL